MKTKLPLLAVGSALLLIGCYVDRPRGYVRSPAVEASYSYVYYPDAEVYYEPQRHVYYWADGGAWRSGPRVPQNIVLRSSVRVNLDSPSRTGTMKKCGRNTPVTWKKSSLSAVIRIATSASQHQGGAFAAPQSAPPNAD